MSATYFQSAAAFHAWLEKHHATDTELIVGFYKRGAAMKGLTYPDALDEALAFGWIDGVRRGVDENRYTIRFTPRKAKSIWSAVNIKRVGELIAAERMTAAGLAAFAKRDEKRSAIYSYERKAAALDSASLQALKADKAAWKDYESRPPWYRRTSAHWVASAKRPETRARRLAVLIECSRKGERIPPLAIEATKKSPRRAR
jgi:uncharacterized protein YdeI (YjbR/CyaY-like superfamily)